MKSTETRNDGIQLRENIPTLAFSFVVMPSFLVPVLYIGSYFIFKFINFNILVWLVLLAVAMQ